MSNAPRLLTELLAAKRFPPAAQLTRVEHFLERSWGLCWRWGWIIMAVVALATAVAMWFGPMDATVKTALMVLALVDMAAWHASLLVVTAQIAAHVLVPRVRNAHEVHVFIHAQTMAARIASYSEGDVAQVEMWLKFRADFIISRARFVLGGEIALGGIFAVLQSQPLQVYLSKGANVLAPVFHVSVDRLVTALLVGVAVVILQVLMVLAIAAGYTRVLRFIDLSRLVRSAPVPKDEATHLHSHKQLPVRV